jgi:DNA-binding FrmR family transcriptional regulator
MSDSDGQNSAARPLRDKRGLVNRVRRLRGQVDAIERALAGEASCSDLLQRITAARGAINGLMAEVLEEHVREYLSPVDGEAKPRQADAAEELIEIIHSYLT